MSAVHPNEPQAPPSVAPDEARLRALFEAEFDFVWRSLRRLGLQPVEADDGAQQVFVVAARRIHEVTQGHERAFLFETARRIASDIRRLHTRRREVFTVDREQPDPTHSPEEALGRKRARSLLDEALDQMSPDLRTVLVLFELEGMTVPEIGAILDVPTGTAASRLRRAREDFQGVVKRLMARAAGPKGEQR
ncbi:RNA polymerase sigma factor RpoE [Minicystis rosea]|nr:RNA polymerase sigma factor RpoE [Minicystis rosea]